MCDSRDSEIIVTQVLDMEGGVRAMSHPANGIVEKRFSRCIFTKSEVSSSALNDSLNLNCACYQIILKVEGGDTYLDILDSWQSRLEVISPREGDGLIDSNCNRALASSGSDPNRRLYNRRSRLSSLDLDSASSDSQATSSPPSGCDHRQMTLWVDAPEFIPSGKQTRAGHSSAAVDGFQSFDQFASGIIRMQQKQARTRHNSSGGNEYHQPATHTGHGWRDLPTRGLRTYYAKKTVAAEDSPPKRHSHHHRKSCSFCMRNGGDKSMYDSHCLRNPITNVIMCPELKKLQLCNKCGDTGDDYVHASFEHNLL